MKYENMKLSEISMCMVFPSELREIAMNRMNQASKDMYNKLKNAESCPKK